MKIFFTLFILLTLAACSTTKPIELAPEELQQKIISGNIVNQGDHVKIVTRDGLHHDFKVKSVSQTDISSADFSIPIDQIVALETKKFSGGKTSLLVGGTLAWIYIILISIPAIVVL